MPIVYMDLSHVHLHVRYLYTITPHISDCLVGHPHVYD